MESTVDINKLQEYMTREGISKRELARRMNIDDGHLVKVLSGVKNPGLKFVQGMISIGYKSTEIFIKKQLRNTKAISNESIQQYVCDYMNTMASYHNKEYKLYDVYNIKNSIEIEKIDRKYNNIKINGNTIEGKTKLNERVAKICNDNFKTKLTYKDVQFYKKCTQLEMKERNLINSIEDSEEE